MSSVMELEALIVEDTRKTIPEKQVQLMTKNLPVTMASSEDLEELLVSQIPALIQSVVALEKKKVNGFRVDGRIIGTGEADFTQGNTCYTLNYMGKTFQLVDVPGIEGNESKYEHLVREAVAKAHLVFYVNGTNKKPEKATAEKIRSYLRRGTQVCPIVNVRGNADAYEFEEDRESLESHSGASTALLQTMDVLKTILDKEVLLSGQCVQGLLAFSSLAMNSERRHTSIHSSRDRDLAVQQRNYLKHFASTRAMFEFSQIRAVAQVLHAKLDTFKEDIIESNKIKVRDLLVENIDILQKALYDYQIFITKVQPEFEKCRESINGSLQSFQRVITAGRNNLWNEFFNSLTEQANTIVTEHFGDKNRINAKIEKVFKALQDDYGERLQAQFEECQETLQSSLSQAMERLIKDVRRVEFQQRIAFDDAHQRAVYLAAHLNMDLSLKDWGSIASNVGSYAFLGGGIGLSGGLLGIAIGAAVGAIVGGFVSAMERMSSKENRIRKAQALVQNKIDEMRSKNMDNLSIETKNLMVSVRKVVKETTLSQIDAIYSSLTRPLDIIQQQIALMSNIKNHLENMPHGTIQAIQR